ncbi:hypothetical protein [Streptomyces sp. WAC05950]|nr:hypothetical protein [Streptomyces sp. WAC05950]
MSMAGRCVGRAMAGRTLWADLVTAEQIARVVARLPTGAYSVPTQTEMIEDQHPIVLVTGMELAAELRSMIRDDHGGYLKACMEHMTGRETVVTNRHPEEILPEYPV